MYADSSAFQDCTNLSKLSLHQIVELYLQLCRNDGASYPEPLYLTLSSKFSVAAEVEGLLAAANEGKGLSEVLSWEEYDAQEAPEENWEEYSEAQFDYDVDNESDQNQQETREEAPEESKAADDTREWNRSHEPQSEDKNDSSKVDSKVDSSAVEGEEQVNYAEQPGDHAYCGHGDDGHTALHEEGPYDEEGKQETESTTTLSNLPVDAQNHGESTEDAAGDEVHDHDRDVGDIGEEGNVDAGTNEDVPEHHDLGGYEEGDANVVSEKTEDQSDEKHQDYASTEHEEQKFTEEVNTVPVQDEAADEERALEMREGDHGNAEHANLEPDSSSGSQNVPRKTPEPSDDMFFIGDDLFKSPAKGREAVDTKNFSETGEQPEQRYEKEQVGDPKEDLGVVEEHDFGSENGEIEEEIQHSEQVEPIGEDAHHSTLNNEDDYVDLGATESAKVGDAELPEPQSAKPIGSGLPKRPREEDEEFEQDEASPTPYQKRSRSS